MYVCMYACMYVCMCVSMFNAKWSPTVSLVHLAQIIPLFRHPFETWQAALRFSMSKFAVSRGPRRLRSWHWVFTYHTGVLISP